MWLRRLTNIIGIPLIIVFIVMAYIEVSPEQEPPDPSVEDTTFDGIAAETGYAISAAKPEAVDAGMDILQRGGNAIDAAIAVSFALGVVEPYGSGIGGGGSMLIYDPTLEGDDRVQYIDYRETAPLNLVTEDMQDETDENDNEQNGANELSGNEEEMAKFGVPGFLKGMDYIYKKYATMQLGDLMERAIFFAENGFEVDKYLAQRFFYAQNRLNPVEIPHYFPENTFIEQGDTLIQEDLANTLQEISRIGNMEAYFLGEFARDMAHEFPLLLVDDFISYDVIVDQSPAKGEFQDYTVYSAPAPLAGPVFIQALQMAELMEVDKHILFETPEEPNEASEQVFAGLQSELSTSEMEKYEKNINDYVRFMEKIIGANFETYRERLSTIGDPSSSFEAKQKEQELTTWEKSDELVQKWKENVEERKDQRQFEQGTDDDILEDGTESYLSPAFDEGDQGQAKNLFAAGSSNSMKEKAESFYDAQAEINQHNNTTHFVIIDREGRMVSATNTLSNFFGSGHYYKGFFLNDQLSNFSETPGNVNAPFPGRRPRSFMSPSILLKEHDGEVEEVIGFGSPGGARIPMMMAEVMIYYSMYDMSFEEAITNVSRFQYDFNEERQEFEVRLEPDFLKLPEFEDIQRQLIEEGYPTRIEYGNMYFGSVQAVIYDAVSQEIFGYADPRRGGKAKGHDDTTTKTELENKVATD